MPLDSFDFKSDEKRTKQTARVMLRMVRRINDTTLTDVPERPTPNVDVTCLTCHHGIARPQPLQDVIRIALDSAGLDSAVRAYRNLRQQYYGRAAYDFGENALNGVALGLARARRLKDALGIVSLNAEFFPNAPSIPFTQGEAYLASGDTASALVAYRKAVELDSTFVQARDRLRRLTGGGRPTR